jgi:mannose-6-phosphate isomerase-like protein (cupin superfamily)
MATPRGREVDARGDRGPVVAFTSETTEWAPHPFAPGLDQAVLLSHRDHGADATVYLYRSVNAGGDAGPADVPLHQHDACDDISYVLEGSATIDIEGHGTIVLTPGSFVRVPAGTEHRIHGVSADFRAINIFAPPRD